MRPALPLFLALFLPAAAAALEPEDDAVFVRVIDTGPGHASVTVMPGGHYMVYDTGHWNHQDLVFACVQELIPEDAEVDLLVQSHSDGDHISATDEILAAYTVKRVLRTGLERLDRTNWTNADRAIRQARASGTAEYNLKRPPWGFGPGSAFQFGDAYVTFLSGVYWPPDETDWDLPDMSKKRNAGSIVLRLFFNGRAILFTGDAVGRLDGEPDDAIRATEAFLVGNAASLPIRSDVLIAAHHGADNGSAGPFIDAVDPTFVIFPAGHDHGHPKTATADRFLDRGVALESIFRTDLGDDEEDEPGEWKHGTVPEGDRVGDDHVDVLIRPDGEILVEYRGESCA